MERFSPAGGPTERIETIRAFRKLHAGVALPFAALAALAAIAFLTGCGDGDSATEREAGPDYPTVQAEAPAQSALASWQELPVLPSLRGPQARGFKRDVARAKRAGMQDAVFAKVGDSNTDYPQNLYGLGCRKVRLGPHQTLAETLRRYRSSGPIAALASYPDCGPTNSFSRDSAAAESGVWTEWLITPNQELARTTYIAPPAECGPVESPLECELRKTRPLYATIMIGSNDVLLNMPLGQKLERDLRRLVRMVREHPSTPVLSTVPPMAPVTGNEPERIDEANSIIAGVAHDMDVPLINLWRALTAEEMINEGLDTDGLHLGYPPDRPDLLGASADLRREALRYGANRRHLVWLRTLARLDSRSP